MALSHPPWCHPFLPLLLVGTLDVVWPSRSALSLLIPSCLRTLCKHCRLNQARPSTCFSVYMAACLPVRVGQRTFKYAHAHASHKCTHSPTHLWRWLKTLSLFGVLFLVCWCIFIRPLITNLNLPPSLPLLSCFPLRDPLPMSSESRCLPTTGCTHRLRYAPQTCGPTLSVCMSTFVCIWASVWRGVWRQAGIPAHKVCTYVYTHVNICIHTSECVKGLWRQLALHTQKYIRTYTHTHTHAHTHTQTQIHAGKFAHMHAKIHTFAHKHTLTHTWIWIYACDSQEVMTL